MALPAGARLGPYELISAVGAGGMGEVYKARDTRLDRTVAIKVLPTDAHADRQARERLEREARAISALTHPHICTLYDIGRAHGVDFLVMEFVDGESLASRLTRGPLPIADALRHGIELASALDRAHRAGIVHRDVKPANVMITRGGIKLLDFGLAKPSAPLAAAAPAAGRAESATEITRSGVIVGTVQYMAPEQIEGATADARTDIFAFGALLYEMVSGRKAFEANSVGSLIAAIVEKDPPRLTSVQPLAPTALDQIIATCLEKDPDDRWQSARDLQRALQLLSDDGVSHVTAADRAASPMRRRMPVVSAAVAAVAAVVAAFFVGSAARNRGAVPPDVRFSVYPEHGSVFVTAPASIVTPEFALSPDGSHLAFVASSGGRPMLWIRPLNSLHARVLLGTEGADYPFWSPDSRWIGFFAGGKLKTINLSGALVVRGDASRDPRGGTWALDGTILATLMSFGSIMSVSPQGSVQELIPVNREAGEANHRFPSVLPDGRHLLYVVRSAERSRRGLTLSVRGETGGTRLVESDHAAAVVDGHLLFVRGRSLMAQPLDLPNRRLTGEPVVLLDNVGTNTTGYAAFSVAQSGALAYAAPAATQGELTWFARDGRQLGSAVAPLADYVSFSFSPDGGRLALSIADLDTGTPDIWLLDLARGSGERLTFDPMTDANAFWSPDGTQILFRSNRTGVNRVYVRGVNDSRGEELVSSGLGDEDLANMVLNDRSRDGRELVMTQTGLATSFDIWRLSMSPAVEAKPVVQTEFDEYHAALSPDGRWLAYVSNETGVPEVYVRSFPEGGQRWKVSAGGATEPQWRADGAELYFLSSERMLTAVAVATRQEFRVGATTPLFQVRVPSLPNPYRQQYRVAHDGQRFLINQAPEHAPPAAIHVVLDWRALLPPEQR